MHSSMIKTQSAHFGAYATRARVRAAEGPTVLCLHGFSDNADGWQPLFAALGTTRLNLVALDLPGFGDGPALQPRPAPLLPQACDFATAALAHYARRGPVILLGHSLGGRAALTAAARRPQDAAAVMALAPAPLRLRSWLRLVAAERHLLPVAARLVRHLPEQTVVARFVASYRSTFFDPDAVDPCVFAAYAAYCDGPRVARYLEDLHRIGGELGTAVDLQPLAMPVDLLWGREDRLVPPAAAGDYRRRIPHARYLEIAGCGHEIAQEKPGSVARVLRQRLALLNRNWPIEVAA
jgi:pimeloyl-ACP methyl ester carboxylesterase